VPATVFGAGANNHQICLPFGRSVHDFALWSSLPVQRFCATEMVQTLTQAFIQDIFSGGRLSLAHLFFSWLRGHWVSMKTLTQVLDIVSWAGIGHKQQAKGGGLSCREHLCRLAYLSDVSAVQTTQYAHSSLLKISATKVTI
jgi:hypothetical protein